MTFQKYFPPDLSLETERVLLRPLMEADAQLLQPLTSSAVLWNYFTKKLDEPNEFNQWIQEALDDRENLRRVPFAILDKDKGKVCGSTSFGNISFFDRRIEIGWSWLGEPYLGSGVNTNSKYALLKYAFEKMDFERVEMKTDNLNERAKQALRKIGAKEEGVLRSHMQMPGNRRRDSVYFSILKNEWEEVKGKCFKRVS